MVMSVLPFWWALPLAVSGVEAVLQEIMSQVLAVKIYRKCDIIKLIQFGTMKTEELASSVAYFELLWFSYIWVY